MSTDSCQVMRILNLAPRVLITEQNRSFITGITGSSVINESHEWIQESFVKIRTCGSKAFLERGIQDSSFSFFPPKFLASLGTALNVGLRLPEIVSPRALPRGTVPTGRGMLRSCARNLSTSKKPGAQQYVVRANESDLLAPGYSAFGTPKPLLVSE